MTKFYYDDRPCGAGKSYDECLNIINDAGLYLYAVERKTAVEERAKEIREMAAKAGVNVKVVTICSTDRNGYRDPDFIGLRSPSVRVRVQGLPRTYTGGHIVVVITHEALKAADLSGFHGWRLVIDERPSIWDRQSLSCRLSKGLLTQHFRLEALEVTDGETINRIVSASDATAKDFDEDTCGSPLAVMSQRIIGDRCTVATRLTSFDDLETERRWEWWSLWRATSLLVFERVTVLAHAWTESVTYRVMQSNWPEIEWQNLDRKTVLRHARRAVEVHYYAQAHQASRTLWGSPRGRRFLRAIADDIACRTDADRHIWTCNSDERDMFMGMDDDEPLIPGRFASPRQQGSNRWQTYNEASILFTAKPSAADISVAKLIGITAEAIIETRELDILVQFACRTSVRVAESTETVHLYVYDEVQARHLDAQRHRS